MPGRLSWFGWEKGWTTRNWPPWPEYAFPGNFPLFPGRIGHYLFEHYTIGFEGSVLLIAAGAIIGIRIGVSMLLGAIFFYGLLAPILKPTK